MPVSVTASCGDGSISRRRGFSRAALYTAIAIAYLAAFFLIGRNILDAPLSYDESGQIFISQGLNHWSHPYSQPLGLGQVIKNNSLYNLDPGGFSILLFFWEKVSHNLIISCCWILLGLWLAYTVVLHFALGCGSLSPAMHKAPWITDWEHELQRREIIDAPQIIVGINPSPAIRYYFEYGSLKEKATDMGYPSKFVLLGRGPHSHLYKMYNYVISDSVTFVDAPHGAALLGIDHGSSDPYIKTVDTDHWAITFKK